MRKMRFEAENVKENLALRPSWLKRLKRFTKPPFSKNGHGLTRMACVLQDVILLQARNRCSALNNAPDWESRKTGQGRRDINKQRARLACMENRICARAPRVVRPFIGSNFEFFPCQRSTGRSADAGMMLDIKNVSARAGSRFFGSGRLPKHRCRNKDTKLLETGIVGQENHSTLDVAMLRVATMLDAANISAVSEQVGESDYTFEALRIKGGGREHIFLLSDQFESNLPVHREFYRNWMGECRPS